MLEEPNPSPWPAGAPTLVVLQTVAEDRGFPVPAVEPGEPLPPARLSLPAIGRLMIMPYCELLSWPLALARWLLSASSNASPSS